VSTILGFLPQLDECDLSQELKLEPVAMIPVLPTKQHVMGPSTFSERSRSKNFSDDEEPVYEISEKSLSSDEF